jgi:hypothetical protein
MRNDLKRANCPNADNLSCARDHKFSIIKTARRDDMEPRSDPLPYSSYIGPKYTCVMPICAHKG